ncbi:MAG: hypothetical protein II656_05245, partial [Ruminococcus sp.]|nr:hypothetical protein [Ruminococcus sp.]
MSVFKCKMCGGTLNADAGKNICQCEYCGTLQTLPHTRDEIIANLFNRANALRIKSDFDTHGFSLNQINIWKLPNLTKTATLIGHTFRVLYLGLSPNGQNIVTGAGDQTLKFWNVFPPFKTDNN